MSLDVHQGRTEGTGRVLIAVIDIRVAASVSITLSALTSCDGAAGLRALPRRRRNETRAACRTRPTSATAHMVVVPGKDR